MCHLAIEGVFEVCACKILFDEEKIFVLNIYRPPSADVAVFLERFAMSLDYLNRPDFIIFICGDFNIDFSKNTETVENVNCLVSSYGARFLVDKPTRTTETSQTVIDNIASNVSWRCSVDTVAVPISDHDIILKRFKLPMIKCV